MKDLRKTLTNLGLSEKEAALYLATMECGLAPASQIARSAKLNRVTTYDILEKLVHKKLVKVQTRAKVKYFQTETPEDLFQRFQQYTTELEKQLPELKKLQQQDNIQPGNVEIIDNEKMLLQIYPSYNPKTNLEIICDGEKCLIIAPKSPLKAILIKDKVISRELQNELKNRNSLLKPLSEKELKNSPAPTPVSQEIDKNLSLF